MMAVSKREERCMWISVRISFDRLFIYFCVYLCHASTGACKYSFLSPIHTQLKHSFTITITINFLYFIKIINICQMRIRVPPGARPGSVVECQLSDGRKASVTIPHGASEGQEMEFQVPKQQHQHQQQQQFQQQQPALPPPASETTMTMQTVQITLPLNVVSQWVTPSPPPPLPSTLRFEDFITSRSINSHCLGTKPHLPPTHTPHSPLPLFSSVSFKLFFKFEIIF